MVERNIWVQASAPPAISNDPSPTIRSPETHFPFLSLPRELRNQVYLYILPHTLLCRRPTSTAPRWWQEPPSPCEPLFYLPLFLICHQIRSEAQELFFHTTIFKLPWHWPYNRNSDFHIKQYQYDERLPFHALLSSTPSAAANMVTRVSKEYPEYPRARQRRDAKPPIEKDEAFALWTHIVSESLIIKQYLPRLRAFDVESSALQRHITERWWCRIDGLKPTGLDPMWSTSERCENVKTVAHALVSWLRKYGEGKACVPPTWLNVRFDWTKQAKETDQYGMKVLEEGLAVAHRLFAEKILSMEEREESGRLWLESLGSRRDRRRKGWCDTNGCG